MLAIKCKAIEPNKVTFKGKVVRYGTGVALNIPANVIKQQNIEQGDFLTVWVLYQVKGVKGVSEQ